jgi:hypothetical protein
MTGAVAWAFRVAAAVSIFAISTATYSYFYNIGSSQVWALGISVVVLAGLSLMLWMVYEFAHSAGYGQGYDRGFQDAGHLPELVEFEATDLANGEASRQDRMTLWIEARRRRDALIARAAKLFTRHKESGH